MLAALDRHKLLVLRDQSLTASSLTEFAAGLGPLMEYPYAEPLAGHPYVVRVVKEADDASNFGGDWHTDTAYVAEPPVITVLYAVDVPERGGDTLFADVARTFAELSPAFQATLRGLTGHHTAALVHESGAGHAHVAGQSVTLKVATQRTEADHPLVIAHPRTGQPALYFSLIHTSHLVGMSRDESSVLLRQLHHLATRADNISRLHWAPGTLAIWDNRLVQHYALDDYAGQRREMYRLIIGGEPPRAG